MRSMARVTAALIMLAAAGSAGAESMPTTSGALPGYYDAKTGIFTALPRTTAAVTASAPTTIKGTLVITATIHLNATITASDTVSATADAHVDDATYTNSVGLHQTVAHSGSTATATFTMPFLFQVASTSDTMSVQIDVFAGSSTEPEGNLTVSLPCPKNGSNPISLQVGV